MALPTNPMELILHAQRALRLNNRTLGEYLGVSKRTVQRWWVAGSGPTPWHLQRLAVDILPTNPELAHRLSAHARATVEFLGLPALPALVEPRPPAPLAAPAPTALPDPAESVVYAAANAADLSPRAIRPALAVALRRALALGLDIQSLVELLERPAPMAKPDAPKP